MKNKILELSLTDEIFLKVSLADYNRCLEERISRLEKSEGLFSQSDKEVAEIWKRQREQLLNLIEKYELKSVEKI